MTMESELPSGAFEALLQGWHSHDPSWHMDEKKIWVSLWPPHESRLRERMIFEVEPHMAPYVKWLLARGERKVQREIKRALGL